MAAVELFGPHHHNWILLTSSTLVVLATIFHIFGLLPCVYCLIGSIVLVPPKNELAVSGNSCFGRMHFWYLFVYSLFKYFCTSTAGFPLLLKTSIDILILSVCLCICFCFNYLVATASDSAHVAAFVVDTDNWRRLVYANRPLQNIFSMPIFVVYLLSYSCICLFVPTGLWWLLSCFCAPIQNTTTE